MTKGFEPMRSIRVKKTAQWAVFSESRGGFSRRGEAREARFGIPSSPPRLFKGRSCERPFYLPLRGSPALQLGFQSSLAYRQYASLLFQTNLKHWASARCPGLTNDSFVPEIRLEPGDCLACFVLPDKMPFHAEQVQIGCKYFLDAPFPVGLFVFLASCATAV